MSGFSPAARQFAVPPLLGRLVFLLVVVSVLAACGGSGSDSSVSPAGSGGTRSIGADVSPTPTGGNGNGTQTAIVSGDFTLQIGSYYDGTAANLAGNAGHYNLDVDSDGLNIQESTAELRAGTTGSFQVCSHTAPDTNLLDIIPWSRLAVGSQYCASDELGRHTMTLLTVRGVSPGSSVTVHVDTWPCAEECWNATSAN